MSQQLLENLENLLENFDSLGAASEFLISEQNVDWYEAGELHVEEFEAWLKTVEATLATANRDDELEIWKNAKMERIIVLTVADYAERMRILLRQIKARIETEYNEPVSWKLFPMEIIDRKNPITEIALQANGCYEKGWYDACAVMLRRIIQRLIIECFERNRIDHKIKDSNDNFIQLEKLINRFLSESTWNVGRNTKNSLKNLPKVKVLGDLSAHNRRYTAKKGDIEKIIDDTRVIIQELATIAFTEEHRT